ncbi:Acetyltransferase (GNAT) family protein [Lentzea waywayandensis]|uniref:Acetyltransferase (GNAT) family protein n=1 Tax=Lentzea waywayandensis TaxID=84724 RepID=A0A1I6ESG8_9PSEU|nr:GNAT family N-acetyltransferase [Lentzea waywayandensis]SFR20680.1 Acetyltransferase (GNAT) family protein [Lentzea waywayandensis]
MTTTWRLRFELSDSPGALARVTVRLAASDCNVLALHVIPVPRGVLDEIVVRAGVGVLPADLIEAVRSEGAKCVGITRADIRDLVDEPTAVLRAARLALTDPDQTGEALRQVLAADSVTVGEAADGQAQLGEWVARRGWARFTQVELTRAQALLDLVDAPAPSMRALLTDDGAALVLRPGSASDEDAVAGLHARCSMRTMFNRYHSGMRTVPRRWLHRLLSPPRGTTIVGQCGDQVVALGQLIHTGTPDCAEVSLLVEDAWQRRGVGAALLDALASDARAAGYSELVAWCLPSETALVRTAARAGLAATTRREDGLLRVSITPRARALKTPITTDVPEKTR